MTGKEDKILKDGKALLEEFASALDKVPDMEGTPYVIELKNVLAGDYPGQSPSDFPKRFSELAPRWDFGYLKVEKKR